MTSELLPPIPFVTGETLAGNPMSMKSRLLYMRRCLDADVGTTTIFAAVPSPKARSTHTRMRGLAAHLQGSEMRLEGERECYNKIQTMVEMLHFCLRAPEFNKWYIVNSLLMRQCAYLSLYFILGNEEFDQYRANISLVWVRIESPGRFVAAVLSRQVGKTAVLAVYLALMLALGRSNDASAGIALYAQGAGLSENTLSETTNLLRYVYAAIRRNPACKHIVLNTVLSTSVCAITIEMPKEWDNRIFHARAKPGRVNNVRGSRENVIIVDEASFMSRDMMARHIVPIMIRTRSGALMTTPGTSTEPGSDMMQQWIDNPKVNFPMGTAEQLSLVCRACYPLPNATRCRHNLSYVPPWKDIPDTLHAIDSAVSITQKEDLERELLGYTQRRIGAAFNTDLIRQICVLDETNIVADLLDHKVIYVVVDPSTGSTSNFALMSFIIYRGKYVCIGAENVGMKDCGNEETNIVVRAHFVALRKQFPEIMRECTVCPLVESNGGADGICDMFRLLLTESFPVTVKMDKHGLAQQKLRGGNQTTLGGVYSRLPSKEAGVSGIHDLAANNRLIFNHKFATSRIARFIQRKSAADPILFRSEDDNGFPLATQPVLPLLNTTPERFLDDDHARNALIKTLNSQMSATIRTEKGDITGKGSSKRENDDVIMVLIIAVCFITRIAGSRIPLDVMFKI